MSTVKLFHGSALHLKGLENDINLWLLNEAGVEMPGMTMAAGDNGAIYVLASYQKREKAKE